jgi:hypothetical protein
VTPEETGLLLATCAAYDQRTTGDADTAAWFEALTDVNYADAKAVVVAHYREPGPRITVGEISAGARKMMRARISAIQEDPPEACADDPAVYLDWLRGVRRQAALPAPALRALTGGAR